MKNWNWFKKLPIVKMIIGLMTIFAVIFILAGLSKSPATTVAIMNEAVQAVEVKSVAERILVINKEYLGYVGETMVTLGADRVQGKIAKLMVEEGDEVSQGDLLFTLDLSSELVNSELQLKEIDLSKSALDLQISQMLQEVEKLEVLYNEGIIALSELKQLQNQLKSLELQRNQIDQQYSEVERALSIIKNQANVISPIDGIIERISIVPGTYIGQQDMIDIRKKDSPKCTIMVAESDLDTITRGAKVQSTIGNKVYEGTVISIKDRDEQQLLFPVEIKIDTEDLLLAGRTVKVLFEKYKNTSAMMIPRSSVINFANETYVYTLNADNTVRKTNVLLGEGDQLTVEITKGLTLKDVVVVKGQFSISEGEKVTWTNQ